MMFNNWRDDDDAGRVSDLDKQIAADPRHPASEAMRRHMRDARALVAARLANESLEKRLRSVREEHDRLAEYNAQLWAAVAEVVGEDYDEFRASVSERLAARYDERRGG